MCVYVCISQPFVLYVLFCKTWDLVLKVEKDMARPKNSAYEDNHVWIFTSYPPLKVTSFWESIVQSPYLFVFDFFFFYFGFCCLGQSLNFFVPFPSHTYTMTSGIPFSFLWFNFPPHYSLVEWTCVFLKSQGLVFLNNQNCFCFHERHVKYRSW